MGEPRLDISDLLFGADGVLCPRWDAIRERITQAVGPDDRPATWIGVSRQWVDALRKHFGDGWAVEETEHFLMLHPWPDGDLADVLLANAEACRWSLLEFLPGVGAFSTPGKEVVIAFPGADWYYGYVSPLDPEEGEFGGSVGCWIRVGYPHIALQVNRQDTLHSYESLHSILTHELTHAALHHLDTPAWLEEGVALRVQRTAAAQSGIELTPEDIGRHKRHWPRRGLGPFWWGHGFRAPDMVQALSYQLAEVLMQILVEEHQPPWFGFFGTDRRAKLLAFIGAAKADDAGQAAAREHLGYGLGELAAKFLGPGDWEPNPADRPAGGETEPPTA
jgi:hypothetical protein